jgi:death-on-curing protein
LPNKFLSKRFVLATHRDLIDSFGGAHGLRDEAALESALAQPEATFGEELLHPGVVEQAAAYLFHLCMAHAFIDGNKRIAFAAMDTFLRLNGYRLVLSDEEAYELTMAVARGEKVTGGIVRSLVAAVAPS